MNPIKSFARFLIQITDMLRKVHRWTHYSELPAAERETVETHSLQTVWLAAAMLAIERKSGRHPLNEARILLAASIHDLGEGRMGDIGYEIKNDKRVKSALQSIEHEFVYELLKSFPDEIRCVFMNAYAVEGETEQTADGEFFNAVERIGYILFAVPQIKNGRTQFVAVFERQHEALVAYTQEYESVRVFYEPYREYVEAKLAEHRQRLVIAEDS